MSTIIISDLNKTQQLSSALLQKIQGGMYSRHKRCRWVEHTEWWGGQLITYGHYHCLPRFTPIRYARRLKKSKLGR